MSLHGVKLNLNHDNITHQLKSFFYNENYEAEEVGILKNHLKPNDIVMEIGAGIGFLSCYCAQHIGSARVFAYEANPFMINKINETYSLNNVTPEIYNKLLTSKTGKTAFFLEKNFWSSSSIRRSTDSEEVEVVTANINDEIKQKKPSFLIIDIEGGEKDLIPLIDFANNQIQKILIEIHPHVIGERKASELVSCIISNSFNLNLRESKGIVLLFER
jgi:FkbM family methyltransferase